MNAAAPLLLHAKPTNVERAELVEEAPPAPPTAEQRLANFEAALERAWEQQPPDRRPSEPPRITERQRARYFEAQTYKPGDLTRIEEMGAIQMRPDGPRLRLRAILVEDASPMTMADELAGDAIEYDARKCITHVITAVGPGVEKLLDEQGWPDDSRAKRSVWRKLRTWLSGRGVEHGARPMVGDHCHTLSTACDRASKETRTTRTWTVHVDDVSLRWEAPKQG